MKDKVQSDKNPLDVDYSDTYETSYQRITSEFTNSKLALFGISALVSIFLAAMLAPLITQDPAAQNLDSVLSPPSLDHPFGTDQAGRDVFSRVIFGARMSLIMAFGALLFATIFGIIIGTTAGYTQRDSLDEFLMRTMDILISFPGIILAIGIMGLLGTDPYEIWFLEITNVIKIMVIIGLVYTPRLARITRGAVLKEINKDYVKAARFEGKSHVNIALNEISYNIIQPIIVWVSYRLGSAMLAAAALGFLGIGVQPPTAEWGVMIGEGRNYIVSGQWWLILFPTTALAITVLSFNLIGDAIRDALDPNISPREN